MQQYKPKATEKMRPSVPRLLKAPTGIPGLDDITRGGLPSGRPTIVCGGPGCGKTVIGMEFLVRGALEFGEPGLFVSFEETPQNLVENFHSLGFDVEELIEQKKLKILHVDIAAGEIIESGTFTLDGLRIRLESAIQQIGAKRVVLDTLETVFSSLSDSATLRRETARLFRWLREHDKTSIITGERGEGNLTRLGFEEYVSDCVILLDHRISEQVSKRRLRIVKYRGTEHGKDEYPFIIGKTGFSVFPITEDKLDCPAESKRVNSGVSDLDVALGGKGFFKGSSILVSGKAGTGKSSLCAAFVSAACARRERALYLAFEESPMQLMRNMKSVGTDLAPHIENGLLTISAFRPTIRGLEEHLATINDIVERVNPNCVVIDPITNFLSIGHAEEIKSLFSRVLNSLKNQGITLLLTALTPGSGRPDETSTDVSSLVDTWIALDRVVVGHVRRRELYIVKSRGMAHSERTSELIMSSKGLSLREIEDHEKEATE